MLTRKEQERLLVIIRQLSDLSINGWRDATSAQWAPLEAELAQLNAKREQ